MNAVVFAATYRRDLRQLATLAHAVKLPLEQLTNSHIRQFAARLHAQGLGPRSLARTLAAWRGFYQWWAPTIDLAGNPVVGVRAPKAPRGLPKALSVEQAQALLDHASAQLATEPAMRGRVVAILLAIALGGTPLGAPAVGWVADHFGPRWALVVGAASGFAAAVVAIR